MPRQKKQQRKRSDIDSVEESKQVDPQDDATPHNPQSLSPTSRAPVNSEAFEESKDGYGAQGQRMHESNTISDNHLITKLQGLISKFRSARDRINTEREILEQDLQKYLLQLDYEQQKSNEAPYFKIIDMSYFKQ